MSAPREDGAAAAPAVEAFDAPLEGDAGGCRVTVLAPRLADGRTSARPSSVLHAPLALAPRAAEAGDAAVGFAEGAEGTTVRARVALPPGTSCYGTGEVVGPLERTGRTATLWNTDAFQYDATTPALYQSHPWVLAVHADGSARGILADTARRGTIAIGTDAVELEFETDPFDLWLVDGPHPRAVTRVLARLAGRMPLPPLWALGYHQCRWSYATAEEVRALAAEFRRRGIPCDGIWLDIDYMERFRVFTVDRTAFPDLEGLTGELRARGFRTVAILDPGVAVDSELAREGRGLGAFVRGPSGAPATGEVWPGPCHFPDFTSAAARAWWSDHVQRFVQATGLDGLWNDMNEPSVRDGPEHTLPRESTHAGLDGSGGDHARWHNLYGQLMVEASRDGLSRARPERRPFVLTRAAHLGTARIAAAWTGDNQSTWEHLRWSIPMALNLGLSGQPFAGPDAGGFEGDPDAELFARWFELAAFLPFFRGHSLKTSCRKEPWSFGPATEAHVRAAIERRMKLLPTLYTLFRHAADTGDPVARPLFFADPVDPALRAVDDAFLLGDDILVAPVVQPGVSERVVRFPAHPGGWFPFPGGGAPILTRERLVDAPLGAVPVFARAGSIVFEHEPRPSTATPASLLVVHVFPGRDGRATGRLYEDEGDGHAHAHGVLRDTRFTATVTETEIEIEEQATGDFQSPVVERCFVVHAAAEPHVATVATRPRARLYTLRRG